MNSDAIKQSIISTIRNQVPRKYRGPSGLEDYLFEVSKTHDEQFVRTIALEEAERLRAKRLEREEWRRQEELERSLLREELESGISKKIGQNGRDAIWDYAWEEGHSDGLDAVRYAYDQLMEVIEVVMTGK